MSLLGLVALLPGAAKKPDTPDVALTRARTEIADLQNRVVELQTGLDALERRILMLESPPRLPTQHELIERQRARDRYSAWAHHQMTQAQQNAYAPGGPATFQNALSQDYEEYIRNCTPGRSEVLRRQR